MNPHELIDARSLELHAVIARELRADPAKLEFVAAWIQRFLDKPDYCDGSKSLLNEWLEIIRNRERDRLVTRTLRRARWRVVRVWECDLAKATDWPRAARRVARVLGVDKTACADRVAYIPMGGASNA